MYFKHTTAYRPPPRENRPKCAPFTDMSKAVLSSSASMCSMATRPVNTVSNRNPDGWTDTLCGGDSKAR